MPSKRNEPVLYVEKTGYSPAHVTSGIQLAIENKFPGTVRSSGVDVRSNTTTNSISDEASLQEDAANKERARFATSVDRTI
ncbi:hypothetical protein PsorP6_001874 [Peronosclerospora sorghi]|uniref:Uncharacterized protein n=1 Tax=Peronosclerospora sorghi TaxID=230839 RepID=A0ACC0WWT3_9STRA|nr:hypothetical protein PsorP6_001874 [Peronosclerospora sorghi]